MVELDIFTYGVQSLSSRIASFVCLAACPESRYVTSRRVCYAYADISTHVAVDVVGRLSVV